MPSLIPPEAKKIIESNPVAIATITPEGQPNVIAAAAVQVVSDNQLLITDVYMNQTLRDLANNSHVAIAAWDKDMNGYKFLGTAAYHTSGPWMDKVKTIPENSELLPKGALLVTVTRVIIST